MSIAYKVWSDNFDGELLSADAYQQLLLTMTTGDFCIHRSKTINIKDISPNTDIICFNPEHDIWHKVSASNLSK